MSDSAAMTRCDCHLAGVCREFGFKAGDGRMAICNDSKTSLAPEKRERQREIWRKRKAGEVVKPPRQRITVGSPPPPGVGTELKALLWWFKIKPGKGRRPCKCNKRAAHMDRMGIDWCEQNFDLIIEWLREGAKDLNVPFAEIAARIVLRRAIKNARRKYPDSASPAAAASSDAG